MRCLAVTASLGAVLLAMTAAPSFAAGDAIFKSNCAGCHYTEGPAREKTIADQLAKKGPELWYAGSKFQKAWLAAWLQDPKPIRPMKYNSLTEKNAGDHPKLSAKDAAEVTDFLMGLTTAEVKAGTVKPKNNPKGRLIFTKKMPCSGCHQYEGRKGETHGGLSGPTLVGAGKRLNPDWIYSYLEKTEYYKPVRDMPSFEGIIGTVDIKNVSAYVASFD